MENSQVFPFVVILNTHTHKRRPSPFQSSLMDNLVYPEVRTLGGYCRWKGLRDGVINAFQRWGR